MIFVSVDLYRNLYGVKQFLREGGVEKIYLFYNNLNNFFGKISRENTSALKEKLRELIDVETIGINPENFDSCFTKFCEIIKNNAGKEIYVDISSTTKIATAVVYTLATLFNIVPYVVIPEESSKMSKEYAKVMEKKKYRKGKGVKKLFILKNEKFITSKELKILKLLNEHKCKINGASNLLRLLNLPITKGNLTKLKYILKKMEQKRLITTKKLVENYP
jgi:hypothetical protein